MCTLSSLDLLSGFNCTLSLGSRKERRPLLQGLRSLSGLVTVASLFVRAAVTSLAWRTSQVVAPARDMLPWAISLRVPRASVSAVVCRVRRGGLLYLGCFAPCLGCQALVEVNHCGPYGALVLLFRYIVELNIVEPEEEG